MDPLRKARLAVSALQKLNQRVEPRVRHRVPHYKRPSVSRRAAAAAAVEKPVYSSPDGRVEQLLKAAREMERSQHKVAKQLYGKAVTLSDNPSADVLVRLASLHAFDGQSSAAIPYLLKALDQCPGT